MRRHAWALVVVVVVVVVSCKGDDRSPPSEPAPAPVSAPTPTVDAAAATAPTTLPGPDVRDGWLDQPGRGFVVHAPHEPTMSKLTIRTVFGELPSLVYIGYQGSITTLSAGQMSVIVTELPAKANKLAAAKLYDQLWPGRLEDADAITVVSKDKVSVDGVEGLDVRFDGAGDPEYGPTVGRVRMFIRDGTWYRVQYDRMTNAKDSAQFAADSDRFIESFQFLD